MKKYTLIKQINNHDCIEIETSDSKKRIEGQKRRLEEIEGIKGLKIIIRQKKI